MFLTGRTAALYLLYALRCELAFSHQPSQKPSLNMLGKADRTHSYDLSLGGLKGP